MTCRLRIWDRGRATSQEQTYRVAATDRPRWPNHVRWRRSLAAVLQLPPLVRGDGPARACACHRPFLRGRSDERRLCWRTRAAAARASSRGEDQLVARRIGLRLDSGPAGRLRPPTQTGKWCPKSIPVELDSRYPFHRRRRRGLPRVVIRDMAGLLSRGRRAALKTHFVGAVLAGEALVDHRAVAALEVELDDDAGRGAADGVDDDRVLRLVRQAEHVARVDAQRLLRSDRHVV